MFTPIHQLSRSSETDAAALRGRWDTPDGQRLAQHILDRIREGAGEDFLQGEFEQRRLGFLEHDHDLRGLSLFQETITFPEQDNFEDIDFAYSRWFHSTFRNGYFNASFAFAELFNCQFEDCTFHFARFYGTQLENVRFMRCQFIERNAFTNCECSALQIRQSFYGEPLFVDCRFDAATVVEDPTDRSSRFTTQVLDRSRLVAIFRGIKEAYAAGDIPERSRLYFFRQMQASRRYNTPSRVRRWASLFMEVVAGYGVRPLWVLRAMGATLIVDYLIFACRIGLRAALILAPGAFFTFGAGTDALNRAPWGWWLWYVLTAFIGVCLTALFVTVLANVWLRER